MKRVREVQDLVGMIGLGLREVEIRKVMEETEVEFCLLVEMLLVEEARVIRTPPPIVTTPSPLFCIRGKFSQLVETTGMIQ